MKRRKNNGFEHLLTKIPIKVLGAYGLTIEILLHDLAEWSFHMHEYIPTMYA